MMSLASLSRSYVEALKGKMNLFGSNAVLTMDGARTTCSSFLGLLLRQAFNGAPQKYMRAREWYAFLFDLSANLNIKDVAPGDIGVMAYDEDRDGMSGHCFVVADKPVLSGSHGDAFKWAVGIVDSCRSHHGLADTRETLPGGIGHGVMELLADKKGNIKGYRWSLSAASEYMHNGKGQHIGLFSAPSTWTIKETSNG